MKRYLPQLLLVCCFLFLGFNKAKATLTITTATTYGAAVTLTTASGATNGLPITSFYINATGTTDDIFTQFTFTSTFPAGTNFTNFKLLVNTSNNIATAVNDNATFTGTGTGTMTVTTPGTYNNFQGLPYDESYKNNTIYYFIVADYTASSAGSLTVNFASASYVTYATGTPGTVTQTTPTGQAYIFNPPAPVTGTVTSLGTVAGSNGTSAGSPTGTIAAAGTYTIYGMKIVAAGPGTASASITGLTFTNSNANGNYYFYQTAYLYAGTATGPTGVAIATTTIPSGTSTTLSFSSFTTTQTLSSGGTLYYYVEIAYTAPGVAATNSSYLSYSGYISSTTLTPTSGMVAGPTYSFQTIPYVTGTATSLTTTPGVDGTYANTPTANVINAAGTYTIYGLKIAATGGTTSAPITGLTFINSNANGNYYFYQTAYLYAGTATGPTGSAIATTTIASGTSTSLAFTFATQTLASGGTLYFYVEIAYTAPGVAATNSSYLSYSGYTSPATITAGAAVAGPTYSFQPVPVVTAANIPAANLTNGTIYIGQTGIAVAGIALSTNTGTTTLTQLTFSLSTTAAVLQQYFTASSVKLVSTTTAPSGAYPYPSSYSTVVGSAGMNYGTAGKIIVTVPSASITTTTTYFYLVADYTYTTTVGATPQIFNFAPTAYTTALSGAVTISPTYTLNQFTCTTPTYYWTGSTSNNWTTAGNWEVTTTAPIIVNGYYPGQISTTDNAIVSPVQTTPTINLTANETINSVTFSAGVATTLNISSGITLTSQYFTIGATSGTSASSVNLTGAGTLAAVSAGTDATINYDGTLTVTNGFLSLPANSELDILGATASPASLVLSGGTINANDSWFLLGGTGASIVANSGTLNAINNTYVQLTKANAFITNNGATINITDCNSFVAESGSDAITNNNGTFNVTDARFYGGGTININGGNFNIASDANGAQNFVMGAYAANTMTITSTGAVNVAGTPFYIGNGANSSVTLTGGSLNLSAAATITTYVGNTVNPTITNNGGTITAIGASTLYADNGPITNTSGTITLTGSELELATGGNSYVNNGGTLNVNASSQILINYANSVMSNTSGTVNLGSLSTVNLNVNPSGITNSGSAIFTCAPTSVLNFNAKNCTIANTSSGPFTLLSDSTGSATVANLLTYTGDAMTGLYNVQRFVTGQDNDAYRNYRILSSPVNKTSATASTTGGNLVDLTYIGQTVNSPATYNGAYLGGPGFANYIANPILYLYLESITPGTTYNSGFTSGKNVGVTALSGTSPNYYATTASTATGGVNSSSVKVPVGNASLLYFIGDNTRTTLSSSVPPASTYITATGYINQGNIPLYMWGVTPSATLTYTTTTGYRIPGVTVVGNPYPATIDLKQVYVDNSTTLITTFYQLDIVNQQYDTYNEATGSSGVGSNRYIASGQGFYINVNPSRTTNTFNFKEDQKLSTTGGAMFPSPTEESVIPIHTIADNVSSGSQKTTDALLVKNTVNTNLAAVSDDGAKKGFAPPVLIVNTKKVVVYTPPVVTPEVDNSKGLHLKLVSDSVTYDECGIYFSKTFSDTFDSFDSKDLDGTTGQVYLSSYTSDNVRTSINAATMFTSAGKRIKLYAKFVNAGIYKFQMSEIHNLDTTNYSVFLIDNMLKDSLDLTLYKSYNFNYAPGTANDSTRFVLAIEHKPVPYYALLNFAGQKVTQGVQLNWTVKNEFNTTKFVVQKLGANNTYAFLDSLSSDSSSLYSYVDQHPSLGNNTYRLQQTTALGVITYSAPVTIGYNSTAPNGGLNIYPNPAKTQITVTLTTSSTAAQVATADIYNTSGTLIEHTVVNGNSFTHDVSSYQLGVYIIELKNSNGLLVGKSKFVKVQ